MTQDKIPIIYLYIYSRFKEKVGFRKTFLRDFYGAMRSCIYRMPKRLIFEVLKEMESFDLLFINHRYIELKKVNKKLMDKVDYHPLW